MLEHFAERMNCSSKREKIKLWDHHTRRIRFVEFVKTLYITYIDICSCLAHVINLATQAVISTYSKAKHFDPANPDAHEPNTDLNSLTCDEVGLVRAITVKVN